MGPKQLKITPQNQKSYKMQVIILFKQIPKNFSGPNPENTPLGPIRGQKDFKNQQIKTLKKKILKIVLYQSGLIQYQNKVYTWQRDSPKNTKDKSNFFFMNF